MFSLSHLNLKVVIVVFIFLFFLLDVFSEKEAKSREVKKCVHCHTVNGRANS